MVDQQGDSPSFPDPEEFSKSMADIAKRSHSLFEAFLARQSKSSAAGMSSFQEISSAFIEMTSKLMSNPEKLVEAQMALWRDYVNLWQSTAERMQGKGAAPGAAPVAAPDKGDRRFKDEAWSDIAVFDFIKQSYLLTSRWLCSTVSDVEGLDPATARSTDFHTRLFVDAMSPSNFLMTNPEVQRATIESGGDNLIKGFENLLDDLEQGNGGLKIKMTDTDAFQVGVNIATTPGKVVLRNDLMELIQYDPSTEEVRKRPLLIITPWINKYYILDLSPKNSFIKWAVDQGHTVFVTSWVNPDESLSAKTFEDYMTEGPMAALDAINQATGEKDINAIGYCIGGTLLACTLAAMAAKDDGRIKSATFFTTMVDFAEPGDLGVFISDGQLDQLDHKMAQRGYLDGAEMSNIFNQMRSNDLIWSFVVNNYLLGREPAPFDLLYWNSDSTRMPAAMHGFYLRKMYLENKLKEPGGLTLGGVPIDLGKIETPTYILSTGDDHIAPWKSTYAATSLYSGPVTFVLAASGHIAGVVNPPAKNKYCHWTNAKNPKNPDAWMESAKRHDGSWWPHWDKWINKHAGGKPIPPRTPGDGKLKPLEDAPGSYVKVRA